MILKRKKLIQDKTYNLNIEFKKYSWFNNIVKSRWDEDDSKERFYQGNFGFRDASAISELDREMAEYDDVENSETREDINIEEDLQRGDIVYAYNSDTMSYVMGEIVNIFCEQEGGYSYDIESGDANIGRFASPHVKLDPPQ